MLEATAFEHREIGPAKTHRLLVGESLSQDSGGLASASPVVVKKLRVAISTWQALAAALGAWHRIVT